MADLRRAPPPRYRVVERDRRLVVLDAQTGEAPINDRETPAKTGRWQPRQVRFDGSAELTTHPLYDEKAPRTIRLDSGSVTVLERLKMTAIFLLLAIVVVAVLNPWLLLPLVALSDRRLRARLRQAATRWLDNIEREAG